MASRSTQVVEAILSAVFESGLSAIGLSTRNPRRIAITSPNGSETILWAYAWMLTPGGRPQLPHEYRIQITSVHSPLALNPRGPTVLMGYEPDRKIFAGFDLKRHQTFTGRSPMVSIDISAVDKALQDGLAFVRKKNQEIAIGVRPDHFAAYMENAEELHRYGRQAKTFDLLARASSLKGISKTELGHLTTERRRIVQTVTRISRAGNFRQQVLHAYGSRCAVTKAQLRLVDAAHILPVGAPGSVDDVRNGIALAPTYHRAYDMGLIYLDDRFAMQVNRTREAEIVQLNLDAGLEKFKASLGRILLPPDKRQWPDAKFVNKANQFRRIGAP